MGLRGLGFRGVGFRFYRGQGFRRGFEGLAAPNSPKQALKPEP